MVVMKDKLISLTDVSSFSPIFNLFSIERFNDLSIFGFRSNDFNLFFLHMLFLFFDFEQLTGIIANDNLFYNKTNYRFSLFYLLLSIKSGQRISLKFDLDILESISSCLHVFSSCIWSEREIWDMFGIVFRDHWDLRRILTDYGFDGFPLRKDFPLIGFFEVYFDFEQQCVSYKEVELIQDNREFIYNLSW